MNQSKQAKMSVNKLIAMVLGAVLLIMIVGGLVTGQLNPLFKNLGTRMDNALAKLGIGDEKMEKPYGDCQAWQDATGLFPEAKWRFCKGYCELEYGKLYTLNPANDKFFRSGVEVSNLLDFDAHKKTVFRNIWNYKSIERDELTPDHLELYDELIGIYKFPGTRKVVVREERTYRIQEDYSTDYLVDKAGKFLSFFLPKKLEYRWDSQIKGAPYLNPAYPLKDLQTMKQVYDYLDPNQNGKCK